MQNILNISQLKDLTGHGLLGQVNFPTAANTKQQVPSERLGYLQLQSYHLAGSASLMILSAHEPIYNVHQSL